MLPVGLKQPGENLYFPRFIGLSSFLSWQKEIKIVVVFILYRLWRSLCLQKVWKSCKKWLSTLDFAVLSTVKILIIQCTSVKLEFPDMFSYSEIDLYDSCIWLLYDRKICCFCLLIIQFCPCFLHVSPKWLNMEIHLIIRHYGYQSVEGFRIYETNNLSFTLEIRFFTLYLWK